MPVIHMESGNINEKTKVKTTRKRDATGENLGEFE